MPPTSQGLTRLGFSLLWIWNILTITSADAVGAPLVQLTNGSRPAVALDVVGSCPGLLDVEQELLPVLSAWTITRDRTAANQIVHIVDHGATAAISVDNETRSVSDPDRNCLDRARMAAVIIALRLDTDDKNTPTESTPAKPLENVESKPFPSPPQPVRIQKEADRSTKNKRTLEFGLSALLDQAVQTDFPLNLGGQLFSQLRFKSLLVQLSGGFESASAWDVSSIKIQMRRLPTDVGVGFRMEQQKLWIDALALLALDPFWARAPELEEAQGRWRLDSGVRISIRAGYAGKSIRPFVQWRGGWFPRHYELTVIPHGPIATMPHFWLGAALGVSFPTINW